MMEEFTITLDFAPEAFPEFLDYMNKQGISIESFKLSVCQADENNWTRFCQFVPDPTLSRGRINSALSLGRYGFNNGVAVQRSALHDQLEAPGQVRIFLRNMAREGKIIYSMGNIQPGWQSWRIGFSFWNADDTNTALDILNGYYPESQVDYAPSYSLYIPTPNPDELTQIIKRLNDQHIYIYSLNITECEEMGRQSICFMTYTLGCTSLEEARTPTETTLTLENILFEQQYVIRIFRPKAELSQVVRLIQNSGCNIKTASSQPLPPNHRRGAWMFYCADSP